MYEEYIFKSVSRTNLYETPYHLAEKPGYVLITKGCALHYDDVTDCCGSKKFVTHQFFKMKGFWAKECIFECTGCGAAWAEENHWEQGMG